MDYDILILIFLKTKNSTYDFLLIFLFQNIERTLINRVTLNLAIMLGNHLVDRLF